MTESNLLIFQAADGSIKLDVRLEDESVWLSQQQMLDLLGKARSTITEHIRNVFNEGELEKIQCVGITDILLLKLYS